MGGSAGVEGLAAVALMACLGGCEGAECKALRRDVEALCGADSLAHQRLAACDSPAAEVCNGRRLALSELTRAVADEAFHRQGRETLCSSLARADESFDGRLREATLQYAFAASTAAEQSLKDSIAAGNRGGAEALLPQIEALGSPAMVRDAASALGWAFLSPVADSERVVVDENTRWISLAASIPADSGECFGRAGHVLDATSDPARARVYFERAEAPALLHYVAYREGDLAAYDQLAALASASPPSVAAVERVNLLVAAGRDEDALRVAEAGAATFEPAQTTYIAYCQLLFAGGRLHERAMRYGQARAAYAAMERCNGSAQGRLAALERRDVVDGEPLPQFTVSGRVLAPGVDSLRVFLTAYDPATCSGTEETVEVYPNASAHENFVRVFAVEAMVEHDRYQARVPPGAWALTVVTTGRAVMERAEACWPAAMVVDGNVDVPDIDVVARPEE
jgi:hypothetical protein